MSTSEIKHSMKLEGYKYWEVSYWHDLVCRFLCKICRGGQERKGVGITSARTLHRQDVGEANVASCPTVEANLERLAEMAEHSYIKLSEMKCLR